MSVKLRDKTVTASGFPYPAADGPQTLAAAATDIGQRLDEMDKLGAAGTLDGVRPQAVRIAAAARLLDRVASAAARPRVADIRRRLLALGDAIDVAIASGRADEVKRTLADLKKPMD